MLTKAQAPTMTDKTDRCNVGKSYDPKKGEEAFSTKNNAEIGLHFIYWGQFLTTRLPASNIRVAIIFHRKKNVISKIQ